MTTDPAPDPHAAAGEVAAARSDRKLANVRHHDWEASSCDEEGSISDDERCITYAAGRFHHAVSGPPAPAWSRGRARDPGCGTGFFLLDLMQAGLATAGSVTDLSPGTAALRNAELLGLDVEGRVADVESIPYADARGRPVRPPARGVDAGGRHHRHPSSAARGPAPPAGRAGRVVPGGRAGGAGRHRSGLPWALFAHRSWLRLSWLDEHLLAKFVPREWFHDAVLTGTRPTS